MRELRVPSDLTGGAHEEAAVAAIGDHAVRVTRVVEHGGARVAARAENLEDAVTDARCRGGGVSDGDGEHGCKSALGRQW